jgi:hypothetical protein
MGAVCLIFPSGARRQPEFFGDLNRDPEQNRLAAVELGAR